MSLKSSEDNYTLAKKIYQSISETFYTIENEDMADEDYLIDQTLEHIKHLNRIVTKISVDELAEEYSVETMDVIEGNIDVFKESSYYIERALSSMQLFNKLNPVLGPYMKRVEWNQIANSEQKAAKKFGAFLTNEDNYEDYKTIIKNIIQGSISANAFKKVFNTVADRIPTVKRPEVTNQTNIPPEMWSDENKEKWDKHKQDRKTNALKNSSDKNSKSFNFSESFVSLKEYNLLLESLAYICQTCGERAEHEEIEENPGMQCPNCGDCNWETEH